MEWYDYMNPHDQPEYECVVCERPIHEEGVCSSDCLNASMR